MSEIKRCSASDIRYLFNSAYKGVYDTKIRRALGDELSKLFAEYSLVSNSKIVVWNIPNGVSGKFYTVGGDENEGVLLMLWSDWEEKIRRQMTAKGLSKEDIDNLLTMPDLSYLFYKVNEGATNDVPARKYSFLLAGWGCEPQMKKSQGADEAEQVKRDAEEAHQKVTVHFYDSQNELIQNQDFSYNYQSQATRTTNSQSGSFAMGYCLIGATIEFCNLQTNQRASLVVIKGKGDYDLHFASQVTATVKVLNQKDEPQAGEKIEITYNDTKHSLVTDVNGCVHVDDVLYFEGSTLKAAAMNAEATFEVALANNNFVLRVDTPEEKPQPPVQEDPEPPTDRYVHIVTSAGESVSLYEVFITKDGNCQKYMSDKDGIILLPSDWAEGDSFTVQDTLSSREQEYVVTNQKEYPFVLPDKEIPQDVNIRVINQYGESIPTYPLTIQVGDSVQDTVTNENGVCPLGELPVGTEFTVACTDAKQINKTYLVEEGKDEYIFQITEPEGPVTIKLVDKKKTPLPNAQMVLTNSKKEEFSHYTNENGEITVPKEFFTHNEKVNVHTVLTDTDVNDCSLKYENTCDHYIVQLKDPFPWGCLWRILLLLLLLALLFIPCTKDIKVKVLECDDNPVAGANVELSYTERAIYKDGEFFYTKNHTLYETSDMEGMAYFEDMPCSVYSWVVYTFSKANIVATSGNRSGSGWCIFHWRFCIKKIRLSTSLTFQVVDACTMAPIPNATVQIWSKDLGLNGDAMITDANGQCHLDCKECNALFDKLLATAAGYSGFLAYDIAVDGITGGVMIIPLDPPAECNTGCDNHDGRQGGHAIRDYYMGQKGGTFLLQYYTDSAPDHIMVYDGTSHDYAQGNAKLIFDFDGATNTTWLSHEQQITFTLEHICVVVDNGTNWGYFVHCPQ